MGLEKFLGWMCYLGILIVSFKVFFLGVIIGFLRG